MKRAAPAAVADEETRRRQAAAAPADEAGLALLEEALRDPSWRVRKAAALRIAEAFPAGKVVGRLTGLLSDPLDAGARAAAADALSAIGAGAVPALAGAFAAGDARMRKAVLDVVAAASLFAGADLAAEGLSDADANVRVAAVEAIGRLKPVTAGAMLSRAIGDKELTVRYAALECLPIAGEGVDIAAVIDATRDPLLERAALRALGRLAATEAIPLIARALEGDPSRAAWTEALLAAVSIAARHPEARDALARAPIGVLRERLASGDVRTAGAAAAALAAVGDAASAPEIAALGARVPEVAGAARRAIGALLPGAADAIVAALDRLEPAVVAEAAAAFAEAPAESDPGTRQRVVAALVRLSTSRAGGAARLAIAVGLARRGEPSGALEPLAERLLSDPSSEQGMLAAEALTSLAAVGGAPAGAVLERLKDVSHASVEARAMCAAIIAAAGEAAAPLLKRLCGDPSPVVRRAALGALARASRALASVEGGAALADEDPSVRTAALAAIAAGEGNERAALAARALEDRDLLVRVAAVRALGAIATPDAISLLLALPAGQSPLLDLAIVEALRGAARQPAVRERLLAYAAVNNPDVSALAHEALVAG